MNKTEPTSKIETITPAIAQEWLDKSSTDNRPLSWAVINSYADTMKNGNWLVNGEAITFDDKGNLLNGHHRLRAVIASATAIQSYVVRGVDHKAFSTYDCGRNRTFGQLITMQGESNGNNVAAIVRTYLVLNKGHEIHEASDYDKKNLHETNKTMVDFYLKNKKFFNNITEKAVSIIGRARVLKSSFVGGSIAYLVRDLGYSEELAIDFFTQLCNSDTSKDPTINSLRKRLFEERNNRKDKLLAKLHSALTIKCWNAYVEGKTVKRIVWHSDSEAFPTYIKLNQK